MYDILPIEDTFLVLGIQDLKQLSTLNPVFLDISNSPTFGKMLNVDNGDIIVSCIGLNDCKKADVNGKHTDVLGVIHTENIANWNQLKSTSSWVNIDLTDYSKESIHDIAEFEVVFLNGRGEHIKFVEGEQKIPQINFAIDAINGKN